MRHDVMSVAHIYHSGEFHSMHVSAFQDCIAIISSRKAFQGNLLPFQVKPQLHNLSEIKVKSESF